MTTLIMKLEVDNTTGKGQKQDWLTVQRFMSPQDKCSGPAPWQEKTSVWAVRSDLVPGAANHTLRRDCQMLRQKRMYISNIKDRGNAKNAQGPNDPNALKSNWRLNHSKREREKIEVSLEKGKVFLVLNEYTRNT